MKTNNEIIEEVLKEYYGTSNVTCAGKRLLEKALSLKDKQLEELEKKLKDELMTNVLETEINGVPICLKCVKTMNDYIEKIFTEMRNHCQAFMRDISESSGTLPDTSNSEDNSHNYSLVKRNNVEGQTVKPANHRSPTNFNNSQTSQRDGSKTFDRNINSEKNY